MTLMSQGISSTTDRCGGAVMEITAVDTEVAEAEAVEADDVEVVEELLVEEVSIDGMCGVY
jgi:mycofactocin precursor